MPENQVPALRFYIPLSFAHLNFYEQARHMDVDNSSQASLFLFPNSILVMKNDFPELDSSRKHLSQYLHLNVQFTYTTHRFKEIFGHLASW